MKILYEFLKDIGFFKNLTLEVLSNTQGKPENAHWLQALIIMKEILKWGNMLNEVRNI